MAAHKVPQDVEAEDKFLGPLTFKQFLFMGGGAISGYLMFLLVTRDLAFLALVLLPFFIICVALAFPWTKDQPTELWLASRIRFIIVPRKRIWDQSGLKHLVSITVPKKEVHTYSDNLNQEQVRSRLSALANVIDSRGWAIKNLKSGAGQPRTDRLIDSSYARADSMKANDTADVMDDTSSTIAQQFTSMIQDSESKHRQATLDKMSQAAQQQTTRAQAQTNSQTNGQWYQQYQTPTGYSLPSVQPATQATNDDDATAQTTLSEQELLDQIHERQAQEGFANQNSHLKVIQPLGANPSPQAPPSQTTPPEPSPAPTTPAIMSLAQNDDLNVETIARQANKTVELSGDDEVVISLHGK